MFRCLTESVGVVVVVVVAAASVVDAESVQFATALFYGVTIRIIVTSYSMAFPLIFSREPSWRYAHYTDKQSEPVVTQQRHFWRMTC